MGRMKVLFCAYRDWGKRIYQYANHYILEEMRDIPNYNMELCVSSKELAKTDTSKYDLIFFIGWSDMIPSTLTQKRNCICLHPSKLPEYRGGSPLQNQIMDGIKTSAITFFIMDEGMDTGEIIYQIPLDLSGNLDDIFSRIVNSSYYVIGDIINEKASSGSLKTKPQNKLLPAKKRRTPSMSEITQKELSELTAEDLYNKIRCLQDPYPNAYIICKDGSKLYITGAHL